MTKNKYSSSHASKLNMNALSYQLILIFHNIHIFTQVDWQNDGGFIGKELFQLNAK
jgi:hypothetical protein